MENLGCGTGSLDHDRNIGSIWAGDFVKSVETRRNERRSRRGWLDIVLGINIAKHHGFSVADHSTERQADFEVNGVAIDVTTHPSEALIRKAAKNFQAGLKPLIVTLGEGLEGAAYLLKATEWKDRIDVIDATQFLTANVYERSLFQAGECKATLTVFLARYNEIVQACETDPVLVIRF
jgi:hypothetical protein